MKIVYVVVLNDTFMWNFIVVTPLDCVTVTYAFYPKLVKSLKTASTFRSLNAWDLTCPTQVFAIL